MDSFEYILAVAEEKNMTKAAAKLFVTQPALSISINRLEKQLGFKIFDRTKSPIELTSEGSLYIQEIRRIRQEEEKLILKLQRHQFHGENHISLGLGINSCPFWLPILLPHLKQKRPELTVQIYDTFDGKMENLIETNEIDAGVMSSIPLSQKLSYIPIGTQRIFLSVPMGSPVLDGLDISNNDIDHPCIIDPKRLNDQVFIYGKLAYGLSRFTKLVLSKYQIRPKSVLNLGNSEASYWCAGAGLGITFSSEEYALNPIAAKSYPRPVICSIENTLWKRPIVLACKNSRTDEPLLQEIASTIRELFYNN